ncbi:MAG: pyridoxamine 5'-phosphate oxidase family protein [Planctomycetota bacterium]|jgi:nitroimidazol reductase NimA-like FMN-containing flavoprotein (pyridoxamine 5'-phosphate oxidase superfamily)
MRRKEREITDRDTIDIILHSAPICHLALADKDQPYVVPMNFGYDGEALYFHCAPEGRKIDILNRNPKVCFVCYSDLEMEQADKACGWTMKYQSVIGFGRASIITDKEGKKEALDIIMNHYADGSFTYEDKAVDKMVIIEVMVDEVTGKQSV